MSQNGKGDSPRNCFSEEFQKNFEDINWSYSTNPSEFERMKPKKTYAKLKKILEYIDSRKKELDKTDTYNFDLVYIQNELNEILECFKKGE